MKLPQSVSHHLLSAQHQPEELPNHLHLKIWRTGVHAQSPIFEEQDQVGRSIPFLNILMVIDEKTFNQFFNYRNLNISRQSKKVRRTKLNIFNQHFPPNFEFNFEPEFPPKCGTQSAPSNKILITRKLIFFGSIELQKTFTNWNAW